MVVHQDQRRRRQFERALDRLARVVRCERPERGLDHVVRLTPVTAGKPCDLVGDIEPAGKAVDELHREGSDAVARLLPAYREPAGPKPLRRWLTGLF